ncbi:NUDIX hydrolase domain-like protein [Gautieria morchelliformis]|nr:NUDIX hydrolase domain-like protein [Gautieria morchelliformis]
MGSPSFVSVVDRCDNFRIDTTSEHFAEFRLSVHSKHVIGLIPYDVLDALRNANDTSLSASLPPVWDIRDIEATGRCVRSHDSSCLLNCCWPCLDGSRRAVLVSFRDWLDTPAKRTQALKTLTQEWRDSGLFSNIISPHHWRDELYPVYIDAFGPRTDDCVAFVLERAACALFGLVTYGVHMTMYTTDWKIWVPTRARTKPTWPLFLDNTVAGGIPYGLSPFEALLKECVEEANLAESFVKAHAKPCGSVSYFYRSTKGYLQPEVQFVYDLQVPHDQEKKYIPKPLDGEVESFQLEGLDVVVEKMQRGLFKPNCALVLVDFMIRHGKITPESEPNYLDVVTRLHGKFGF